VLQLNPYHTKALASLGMLMRMVGRIDEAAALYLQVTYTSMLILKPLRY
jgi:hypothetical protein